MEIPRFLVLGLVGALRVSEGEVSLQGPAIVHSEAPEYPVAARKARMEGFAVVNVTIAGNGDVLEAWSAGTNPLLAGAARRAAGKWRFSQSADLENRCATLGFRFMLSEGEGEDGDPEVSVLSPYSLVVAMPPYPTATLTIVDPAPEPCFVRMEAGSMTFCEKALRLLPLR